jgi:hypothetical protein
MPDGDDATNPTMDMHGRPSLADVMHWLR